MHVLLCHKGLCLFLCFDLCYKKVNSCYPSLVWCVSLMPKGRWCVTGSNKGVRSGEILPHKNGVNTNCTGRTHRTCTVNICWVELMNKISKRHQAQCLTHWEFSITTTIKLVLLSGACWDLSHLTTKSLRHEWVRIRLTSSGHWRPSFSGPRTGYPEEPLCLWTFSPFSYLLLLTLHSWEGRI